MIKQEILYAAEFGFKAHKRGDSLQKMLTDLHRLYDPQEVKKETAPFVKAPETMTQRQAAYHIGRSLDGFLRVVFVKRVVRSRTLRTENGLTDDARLSILLAITGQETPE